MILSTRSGYGLGCLALFSLLSFGGAQVSKETIGAEQEITRQIGRPVSVGSVAIGICALEIAPRLGESIAGRLRKIPPILVETGNRLTSHWGCPRVGKHPSWAALRVARHIGNDRFQRVESGYLGAIGCKAIGQPRRSQASDDARGDAEDDRAEDGSDHEYLMYAVIQSLCFMVGFPLGVAIYWQSVIWMDRRKHRKKMEQYREVVPELFQENSVYSHHLRS